MVNNPYHVKVGQDTCPLSHKSVTLSLVYMHALSYQGWSPPCTVNHTSVTREYRLLTTFINIVKGSFLVRFNCMNCLPTNRSYSGHYNWDCWWYWRRRSSHCSHRYCLAVSTLQPGPGTAPTPPNEIFNRPLYLPNYDTYSRYGPPRYGPPKGYELPQQVIETLWFCSKNSRYTPGVRPFSPTKLL